MTAAQDIGKGCDIEEADTKLVDHKNVTIVVKQDIFLANVLGNRLIEAADIQK